MNSRIAAPLWALLTVPLALPVLTACFEPTEPPGSPEQVVVLSADPMPADPMPADPPEAAEGAFAPWLATGSDGLLLTWLEPTRTGHRLRFSRTTGSGWTAPVTLAEGPDFFANWADVPSVAEAEDGTLLAHWLEKTGEATYAYGIRLARSEDRGATWQSLGFLHDDGTPTEHGFVSLVPAGGKRLRAFWLDGRRMVEEGPMTLRTALVGERVEPSEVLDERVCDCCPTAAVRTPGGPLVAYRDRSPEEVRDVVARRFDEGAWTEPRPLHRDGWFFPACPVNGPALAAAGDRVAAAWFTGEGDAPRVLAAFSDDGGRSFGPPIEIDRGEGVMGRVGTAWSPTAETTADPATEAIVSWLAAGDAGGIRLRRVTPEGRLGAPWKLADTTSSRASGIARLVAVGDRLAAVWVSKRDDDSPSRLGFRTLSRDELPPPG